MFYWTDEKLHNGTAHSDYEKYCQKIWKSLPSEFRTMHKGMLPEEFCDTLKYDMHDKRILGFVNSESCLKISYEMWSEEEDRPYKLHTEYLEHKIIQDVSQFIKSPQDHMDRDLACHEVAVLENNIFQHSILFVTGEELIISFKDFHLYEE